MIKPDHKHPHLGQVIERVMQERGMSKAELGRRINTSRQNVALILDKPSLDTELLWRIGDVLQKDFFLMLSFRQTGHHPEQGVAKMVLEFSNQRLVLLTAKGDGMADAVALPIAPEDGTTENP